MSKLKVRGTLVTLVLFAAVAVFPDVVQALGSKRSNPKAACGSRSTGGLMADGSDPWPPPPPNPIPWPNQAA